MLKLLFIGFATVDIYPDGDKIPGGAGGGMALNAAKLGVKSSLLTVLGEDENGSFYKSTLETNNIDTSLCTSSPNNPTCKITNPFGESFKRDWSHHGAISALVQINPQSIDFKKFDGLIFANAWPKLVDRLEPALTRQPPIFYIPGPHIVRDPSTLNKDLLSKTTTVLGNQEESPIISAVNPIKLGAKIIVTTLGKQGCEITTQQEKLHFPSPKIDNPVDATGAGDCFALGFIVEYLKSKNIHKAVKSANQLASKIISKQGVLL